MGTQDVPAGWFTDPAGGEGFRYWDGRQWTDHRAKGQPLVAAADVDRLERDARRATIALGVAVPLQAVGTGLQSVQVRQSRRALADLRTQLDELERQAQQPGAGTFPARPSAAGPVFPSGSLTGLPTLVVGVIFLIWFHRAATVAAGLRRPARRSPGWAVGGWFIPIGNFFLPYQSARDFFRPGDPGRATVKRWWIVYLVAALAVQPLTAVAGLHDHHTGATFAALCALGFVLWLWAFFAARDFIGTATSSLREEVGNVGAGAG